MCAKTTSVHPLPKFNVFIVLLCTSYYLAPLFNNLFTLYHAALYLTTQLTTEAYVCACVGKRGGGYVCGWVWMYVYVCVQARCVLMR